ncbi:MAG: hypothetical protein ACREAQ_09565 [Nitrososphaera sp.]
MGSETAFTAVVMLELIVIPIAVGAITSLFFWRRRLGSVSVKRFLTNDSANNKIHWKLLVTAAKPVQGCTVRAGKSVLLWEGTKRKELDIGPGGAGQVVIPHEMTPGMRVTIKSGPFTIFQSSFRNVSEVCVNC